MRQNYSIIGGAATLLHLEERAQGEHNKATQDLDIAVLDLSTDGNQSLFFATFSRYVAEMEYEAFVGQTGKTHAYRFVKPKKPLAPSKIEIATRQLDGLRLKGNAQRLTDFDISAIVCDQLYIEHLKTHSEKKPLLGPGSAPVNVARVASIILMKALAYVNLSGEAKTREHANRHASDVIRLSAVLRDADSLRVPSELYAPFEKLLAMKDQAFNLPRVAQLLGAAATGDKVVADLRKFITLEEERG
ncbi:hypothetical protein WDW37_14195 [Bdellovibrionota bacterium FG-1]